MCVSKKVLENVTFTSWLSTVQTNELENMLNEENYLEKVVRDTLLNGFVKDTFLDLEMKIKDRRKCIEAMAAKTLEKEHIHRSIKAEIMNLSEEGKTKIDAIKNKHAELRCKLNGILQTFQRTLEESHVRVEEILQTFLQGGIYSHDFSDKFVFLKTKFCLKEVKTDKFKILFQARF